MSRILFYKGIFGQRLPRRQYELLNLGAHCPPLVPPTLPDKFYPLPTSKQTPQHSMSALLAVTCTQKGQGPLYVLTKLFPSPHGVSQH